MQLDDYKASAQFQTIQGHKLAYWLAGSGETIVCIHGFPSASWDWHKLWPDLQQDHQILSMDMLGFGLSAKPYPHAYSVVEQARLLEQLVLELGIERAHILAHDYGDSVAQELLTRQYEGSLGFTLQSVCYLNGGLFPETHKPLLMQKLLAGPLGPLIAKGMSRKALQKSFSRIFGKNSPPTDTDIDILWTLLQHQQGRRVVPKLLGYIAERRYQRARWVSAMQKIDLPQGLINGVQDPISGAHMLARFQQLLPQSPTWALDVGHYPQIEKPLDVLHVYRQFLASLK